MASTSAGSAALLACASLAVPSHYSFSPPRPPCLHFWLQKGEGPIAVIVAPTRELAEQIHKEARACATAWLCLDVTPV